MKDNYTHLTILLDSSGSMAGCWNETIVSINNLIEEQKKVSGEMTLSLHTFSKKMKTPLSLVDIQSISKLDVGYPDGFTALHDNFCFAVDGLGKSLSSLDESKRPSKILFVVITDGEENSSIVHTIAHSKQRVQLQRDVYKWNFMFMGADFSTDKTAESLNLSKSFSWKYDKSKTTDSFVRASNLVSNYRNSQSNILSPEMVDKEKDVTN
jgi:uncharacterized protein YegL